MTVFAMAEAVRNGTSTATFAVEQALAAIERGNPVLNAVTRTLPARALARAAEIDRAAAQGLPLGPLAGVPFGVKDLFDVAGLPTTAGAGMRRDAAPALRDADAIVRLEAAGAILVATLNMDEFAYGFATINAAFGTTRNPHDPERLAGGSSGGSAAAVGGGLLPFTLGSDTNGSVRVPASLCGVFGLKPTHGALPMGGVFPFVESFDDIGPFARSAAELEQLWRVLGGSDAVAESPTRIARLGGWFARDLAPELAEALEGLGLPTVELPGVERARSAAFLMTAAEGGALHLPELRTRALDYDPATRSRLIAGATLPASIYFAAQAYRERFRRAVLQLFERFDVLVAPTTADVAPLVDDPVVTVAGARVPARAHLGIFTQPLSFVGLPVIAAPLHRPGKLPLGIQLVGPPGSEARLFALARRLEAEGVVAATPVPAA